jgi:hypothetical protein
MTLHNEGLPINLRSLMSKPRYKTTNWKQYNQALINRGSLTFWIDEEAFAEWKQSKQGKCGRPRRFSDIAITTALMVKRVFLYAVESTARIYRLII